MTHCLHPENGITSMKTDNILYIFSGIASGISSVTVIQVYSASSFAFLLEIDISPLLRLTTSLRYPINML